MTIEYLEPEQELNITQQSLNQENINITKRIPILPSNPVKAKNGKQYYFDVDKVINNFKQRQTDLPIDINHESELNAKKGLPAPAVGWVKNMVKEQDGSVWGDVEWTEVGEAMVKNKQSRYISPACMHNSKGEIDYITSVALTNSPNFYLQSLNSEQTGEIMTKEQVEVSNIYAEVIKELDLEANSGTAEVLKRIKELKEQVVREKALIEQVNELNQKVVEIEREAFEKKKEATLNSLREKGKIAPVVYDFYKKTLNSEHSLEEFEETMEKIPSSLEGSLKPKVKLEDKNTSEFAKKYGIDNKKFLETKAKLFN